MIRIVSTFAAAQYARLVQETAKNPIVPNWLELTILGLVIVVAFVILRWWSRRTRR